IEQGAVVYGSASERPEQYLGAKIQLREGRPAHPARGPGVIAVLDPLDSSDPPSQELSRIQVGSWMDEILGLGQKVLAAKFPMLDPLTLRTQVLNDPFAIELVRVRRPDLNDLALGQPLAGMQDHPLGHVTDLLQGNGAGELQHDLTPEIQQPV